MAANPELNQTQIFTLEKILALFLTIYIKYSEGDSSLVYMLLALTHI